MMKSELPKTLRTLPCIALLAVPFLVSPLLAIGDDVPDEDQAEAAMPGDPDSMFDLEQVDAVVMEESLQFRKENLDTEIDAREPTSSDPGTPPSAASGEASARVPEEPAILPRYETREDMLAEVDAAWRRPTLHEGEGRAPLRVAGSELKERMQQIYIPKVSFAAVPLGRVIDTLSALSDTYDPAEAGINIVLIHPGAEEPEVSITLRKLSLDRILDFVVESVGYEYDVQDDAVVIRPGLGENARLETEFFPLSRSTMIRLIGLSSPEERNSTQRDNPFDTAPAADSGNAGAVPEETALKQFLQRAGVPFASIAGADLALADGQLIVTQTPRNLERVRNILRRYSEIKQVEIEARFIEVQDGTLEELGFNWHVGVGGENVVDPITGNPVYGSDGLPLQRYDHRFNTSNRSLATPFSSGGTSDALRISRPPSTDADGRVISSGEIIVPQKSFSIPNMVDLGAGVTTPLASLSGVIGSADVDLVVRALERTTGNELLSAPKVTVLSGKSAEIVVAQELRYPERYGDIDAQVGSGDSEAGSAGVAITAGTPEDFVTRNVGMEMRVTPTVEDNNAISLVLEPKVTEFEGFVEYGGTSVAISADTTVTVPSGFFQPIFSVRKIRTEVTIWDGATVVMGGLTREHAVSIEDRVPVLGSIPFLGRLFRSEAESTQKRNLIIFVTANLIGPGGARVERGDDGSGSGALYRNPYYISPSGVEPIPDTEQ